MIVIVTYVHITYEYRRSLTKYQSINRLSVPEESTATPRISLIDALVAGPLSPLKLPSPVPAIVEIVVVDSVTFRMRWLPKSAM